MKRSKKVTKMTKNQVARLKVEHKRKWLACTTCSNEVMVDEDVIAVKCPICTCKMAPLEKRLTQTVIKSDKPAGWRFMSIFVDKDGNVYHFGEEQPKLKNTLEPSDVDKIRDEQKQKRKISKSKKEFRNKLKEERMAEQYKKKMKAKKKEEIKKQAELDRKLGKTTESEKPVKKSTKKTKKITTPKTKKPTKGKVKYEKFEEPKILTDRQQIQKFVETESMFAEHLKRRQINVPSITKVARSSYAAIDTQSGVVTNRRRGYKVTLSTGDVNIININVK